MPFTVFKAFIKHSFLTCAFLKGLTSIRSSYFLLDDCIKENMPSFFTSSYPPKLVCGTEWWWSCWRRHSKHRWQSRHCRHRRTFAAIAFTIRFLHRVVWVGEKCKCYAIVLLWKMARVAKARHISTVTILVLPMGARSWDFRQSGFAGVKSTRIFFITPESAKYSFLSNSFMRT